MLALLGTFDVRRSIAGTILLALLADSVVGQMSRENTADRPATHSSLGLQKPAVPDAESLEKANGLLREIYKDKFAEATTAAAQKRLARDFLGKASELTNDAPSCYVLQAKAHNRWP